MDQMRAFLEDVCGMLTRRELEIMLMTAGESPSDLAWEFGDSEPDEDELE